MARLGFLLTLSMLCTTGRAASATSLDSTDAGPAAPTADDFASGGSPGGEHRHALALEVAPLGLFIGHYGASLELMLAAHHGIILSGYYASTENGDPRFVADPNVAHQQAPTNTFTGAGGELGYRYYFGNLGPHGLYFGPSLLFAGYRGRLAVARSVVDYQDFGGAIDVGYQAILDHVVLGIGIGAQYVYVNKTLPDQQDTFTNVHTASGLRPRATLSAGYVF
jgi:hypothetical protein